MSNMQGGHTQSYKDVRATFVETKVGRVELSLAVGQEDVAIINNKQLKGAVPRRGIRDSTSNPFVNACRSADIDKFDKLCKQLEAVTIA